MRIQIFQMIKIRLLGGKGFTLVELMITLFLSSFITMALYSAYLYQQRSQSNQDQVVEMQQNLRSGITFMTAAMRMAGFDPTTTAGAGIVTARKDRFQFTLDTNDNGAGVSAGDGDVADPQENITFGFSAVNDPDGDGVIAGGGTAPLGRDTGGGFQPFTDNISAVEFLYVLDDETRNLTPAAAQFDNIRAVVISILARSVNPDQEYVDAKVYTTGSGATWGPYDDGFRRRFIITTVNLRNMGL